ncbi:HipA domain-containing protein [Paenibacillus polymyxa]|uniref:HipA domain-containing protein n=1 Tax=Paenibacillus polymyxa TaxID=1406 RepID=UPI002ED57DBD|nr:HipA domain-containing protein [Paenibacillus polymyxa]
MEGNSIKVTRNATVGSWNLKKYGIRMLNIPLSRRLELVVGTYNSAGVFKKFNINHNNWGLCYIKSGSSKGRHFSVKEPIVERICYEIGKELGFNVTPYVLHVVDMQLFNDTENPIVNNMNKTNLNSSFKRSLMDSGKVLVTASQTFIGPDDNFFSCRSLYDGISPDKLHSVLCRIHGDDIKRQLGQMILFDFIVHNTDRHTRNFGFLKDSSGKIQMAPLFDHGLALLAEFDEDVLREDEMEALGHSMGQPFGSLLKSLDYVGLESFKGLKLDTDIDVLKRIIDGYSELLSPIRIDLMKRIVERGVTHVRKVLSSLQG